MQKLFYKKVESLRNPFRVVKLPLLAKLCKYWFDNLPKKKYRRKAKFIRACFVYLNKLGVKSNGVVKFSGLKKETNLVFNARNTQFSSLYLERYKEVYEAEVSTLLDTLLPLNGIFYDVGSNFGYFSLYAASRPGFTGKIFAFEPHPLSYVDLTDMIKQSELTQVIHPYNLAVHSEKKVLYVRPSGVRSGNFSLIDKDDCKKNTFKVQTDLLDELDLPAPDVMKIDTDGSEADVFKGAMRMLAKARPHIIFESSLSSSNPKSTFEPFHILQNLGYKFFYLAWMENIKDTFYLKNAEEPYFHQEKILALNLIDPSERFLFAERLNILAVHKERVAELKTVFKEM